MNRKKSKLVARIKKKKRLVLSKSLLDLKTLHPSHQGSLSQACFMSTEMAQKHIRKGLFLWATDIKKSGISTT